VSDSRISNDDDWSQLESALQAFSSAWEQSPTVPSIAEFLQPCAPFLRSRLAKELIKIDLEQRWQRGLRRLIEDYRDDVPGLDHDIDGALIFEEYHARKQADDAVRPEEYFQRFPERTTELAQLFGVDLGATVIGVDERAPSESAMPLQPGDRIDDFELLIRLGQGAFATVFLARQQSMQRLVAVKVSANHGTEPQTMAQLDHPNIIRVYDQRTVPDRQLRLLYMQYAAGGTLSGVIDFMNRRPKETWSGREFLKSVDQVLEERGETPPAESAVRRKLAAMTWPQVVAWIGTQLAQALHAAHRQGVLHRDLKPANVLLTAEGVPKLADFNISFSANLQGTSATDGFGGSLSYMSPEQLEAFNPSHARTAESLDARSDLYALGVLLWELLTGERPFDDRDRSLGLLSQLTAMTRRRLDGPTEAKITTLRQMAMPGLEPVLRRCLASEVDARYSTGLELAREFELCLQPDARRLIAGAETGWLRLFRRFPLVTVTVITVIPNLIAAIFNFIYNYGEIMARMPDAKPTFMRTQTIINLITFPAGISCAGWLAGSVARAVKGDRRRELTPQEQSQRRAHCLDLGNLAAIVGLTLWLLAAPAYPIALHLMLGDVPPAVYAHFVASLALCGLIAAAYPFFGVTVVALRSFYPRLLHWNSISPADVHSLQRLSRQCWLYLGLAASVPMIAVVILVLSGSNSRFELVALAAGGVLGFGIALTAFRIVQTDLATLIRTLSRED
jgi:serine/threonine protein kinase